MNKLKKVGIVFIIIALILIIYSVQTYAALSGSVGLTTQSTPAVRNSEISVYIRISSLQSDKGIVAVRRFLFI